MLANNYFDSLTVIRFGEMQFANILNLCVCVRLCVCVKVCVCARVCVVSSGVALSLHRDDLSILSIFHNVINKTLQTLHFFLI